MVKRFHSGRAAQSGVYSALLARSGFTGITDVLEAPYGGYLTTHSDAPNAARLTAGLGTTWETLQVGYKPHASVTSIHTALDGLSAIMRENTLAAEDIAKVETGLSPMTHVHCAWEYKAQGVTAAQMNLYYGLAVIALDGVAFTEQYREERLRDPRILDFVERIRRYVDPEIERMGARVQARGAGEGDDARRTHVRETAAAPPRQPREPADAARRSSTSSAHVVAPCVDKARARAHRRGRARRSRRSIRRDLIACCATLKPSGAWYAPRLGGNNVRGSVCRTPVRHCVARCHPPPPPLRAFAHVIPFRVLRRGPAGAA